MDRKIADIYIKDEGEFLTVIFNEKALKAVSTYPLLNEGMDGNKLDIEVKSAKNMVVWATTNGLTSESEVEIN